MGFRACYCLVLWQCCKSSKPDTDTSTGGVTVEIPSLQPVATSHSRLPPITTTESSLPWSHGFTFENRRFRELYDSTTAIEPAGGQAPLLLELGAELLRCARSVVEHHVRHCGIDESSARTYIQTVERNVMRTAEEQNELMGNLTDRRGLAVRIWTTAEQLSGIEFCSMLNQATREDRVHEEHIKFIRTLNLFCVDPRTSTHVAWALGLPQIQCFAVEACRLNTETSSPWASSIALLSSFRLHRRCARRSGLQRGKSTRR